jgi:hypothetical protein
MGCASLEHLCGNTLLELGHRSNAVPAIIAMNDGMIRNSVGKAETVTAASGAVKSDSHGRGNGRSGAQFPNPQATHPMATEKPPQML